MGRKATIKIFQATKIRNLTEKNWAWLRKGNLQRETEFILIAQNDAIQTNYFEANIDKTKEKDMCRL